MILNLYARFTISNVSLQPLLDLKNYRAVGKTKSMKAKLVKEKEARDYHGM